MARPLLNKSTMNVSLYQAAAAMNANMRWQEVIAQNLTAGSIPGFKKQDVSFSAVAAGLMPSADAASGAAPRFGLPRATPATNFEPGELQYTAVNTDVAIEGQGLFEVRLANGVTAYTRDGRFRIDPQGQLVSNGGHPVMSDTGTIQVDRSNPAPISISVTGEVSQGGNRLGRIRVVNFNQPQALTPAGGGLFLAIDPNLVAAEIKEPNVRQGFVEESNTSPVIEMSNLVNAMRSFEADQRIIQMHDDRMGRAITELGNPA